MQIYNCEKNFFAVAIRHALQAARRIPASCFSAISVLKGIRTVNSVAARMVWCMAVRNYSTKKLDLSGQTFGRLTVLAPAENIGGKTAWLCQCECGNTAVVLTQRLRDGHRTSCGCDSELFGETPAVIGRASLTYIDGTCVEMIRAKTVRKNNTSGVPGVDWVTCKRLWRATICFKGKRHYLGTLNEQN